MCLFSIKCKVVSDWAFSMLAVTRHFEAIISDNKKDSSSNEKQERYWVEHNIM